MGFLTRTIRVSLIPTAAATAAAAAGWCWYVRDTQYEPFNASSTEFKSTAYSKLNPNNHPPVLADHASRKVPLSRLKHTDPDKLLLEFCRGIWTGPGFTPQRWIAKRTSHGKEGMEDMLWDKDEFERSDFEVGTRFANHFEVMDKTPNKLTVRCGDSPVIAGPREWDGTFTMEVTTDGDAASFHLKSIFFDSRAAGANAKPFPGVIKFLHRQYTMLWMETSVRKLGRESLVPDRGLNVVEARAASPAAPAPSSQPRQP